MGGAPSKPDPTAKLQVVGAGYSKTGTNSMQLALQTVLDGPVMHCGTHILAREDCAYFHPNKQAGRATNLYRR
jgi:chloramphenicol 3-O-phosphotransferase